MGQARSCAGTGIWGSAGASRPGENMEASASGWSLRFRGQERLGNSGEMVERRGRGLLPGEGLEDSDHWDGAGGLEEGSFQSRGPRGCSRDPQGLKVPVGRTRPLERGWIGGSGVWEGCRRKAKDVQLPTAHPGDQPQTTHSGTLFLSSEPSLSRCLHRSPCQCPGAP